MLVLVRHGQSRWNADNRFTGWVDEPLSELGLKEAAEAGRRLAAEGVRVDLAFTSTLVRAIQTGEIVLRELGQPDLEQQRAWQLNERFYGRLTGRDKDEARAEFGEEQVRIWRRSFETPPPGGESLADTAARALPYFNKHVLPPAEDRVVLVSAHGNSLRAIVKELDGLDDGGIADLEIPTGEPVVYDIAGGRVTAKRILDGA